MSYKIKTAELTGAALDWAVVLCEGRTWEAVESFIAYRDDGEMNYSTDWSQGGPIIEREKISVINQGEQWSADNFADPTRPQHLEFAPTPLIAAMRCFVASKLGDEVEIADEL